MKSVFADAGYWIALFNPRDRLHSRALTVSQKIKGHRIITSHAVLTEFLNYYAGFGVQFRQKAAQFVRRLEERPDLEIVEQAPEQFEAALILYTQRPDKA